PLGFGRLAGRLIAADELTGRIYAFGAAGRVQLLASPAIKAGSDIGVESLGFVPRSFTKAHSAYLADLGAPGSPTTGSDSLLRMQGTRLVRAGVRGGDLVVATEASGVTFAIRCRQRCGVRRIGHGLDTTHAEGHIAFSSPSRPPAGRRSTPR